ncbi:MAG: 30S ribosomal protein S21 [Proteobacteria bacterium]|nr:30S ribosomal protein S21 [Pseudomonadota bacterium]NBP15666.1 30S ribosomal protein S21 [bacterium]
MNKINVEVKLDKKKSLDKAYFDKMYNKFAREVQKAEILEELRLRRCFYKPSKFKRVKKEYSRLKWLYYK